MRTTITINDKLFKTLKIQAAQSDQTISSLVSQAIRDQLLEDLHDIKIADERKDEPTISHDKFVAELRQEGLL